MFLVFYDQVKNKKILPLIPLSQIHMRSYFATSYPGIKLLILGLMPTFLPPKNAKVQ